MLLLPLSWLYGLLIASRRALYRSGILKSHTLCVPVIIVGNITVGGTGKTPVTAWLSKRLAQQGLRPGIILRGYGGNSQSWPVLVDQNTSAEKAGDESLLLHRLTGLPVAAGPNRVQAARKLVSEHDCNIIISDDGLQHYALNRNVEIAIVDRQRGFQNGRLLPAGPLREPVSRMNIVDLVLSKTASPKGKNTFCLTPTQFVSVVDNQVKRGLDAFDNGKITAVAAIGNPESFFLILDNLAIQYQKKVFPDHHPYVAEDLQFAGNNPIIMTQKDAVKCEHFATQNLWYLEVDVNVSNETEEQIDAVVRKRY